MNNHNVPGTRRQCLKAAGALAASVAAGPMILPRSVFGANAPTNRITMGCIGVGRQAHATNIPGFVQLPQSQIAALCDVDSWRMNVCRKQVEDYHAKKLRRN